MIRLFLIVCADRLAVVFFAFVLLWSSSSFALQPSLEWVMPQSGGVATTAEQACADYNVTSDDGTSYIFHHLDMVTDKQAACYMTITHAGTPPVVNNYANVIARYRCPLGEIVETASATCPDNCPPGEFLGTDGTCHKDCSSKLGQALPNDMYSVGAGRKANFWGCEIQCAKGTSGIAITNLTGGTYEFIGEACTYTGKPEQPENANANSTGRNKPKEKEPWKPEDCLGKGDGYIQGSSGNVTCVPAKQAPDGQKPDKVTESNTKSSSTNGGDTIKTTTESVRTGGSGGGSGTASGSGGGTVKTTETSTTQAKPDGNGGTTCPPGFVKSGDTCTQTKTTETTAKSFCDENPKSYVCNGEGGDDMCSKAENKSLAACTDLGKPEDTQGDLATKPFNLTAIPTVAFAASNTCPSSINLPHGAVFTFEPICDAMGWLRPIVLAMAWLSAGLIVVGALRT